jgi:hypothetical protein
VFQTVWNGMTERPPDYGIRDYDLVYHDASDLSWEAEDRVIRRAARAFSGSKCRSRCATRLACTSGMRPSSAFLSAVGAALVSPRRQDR